MSPETRQQLIALILGIIFIIGFILFAQRLGNFLRNRQNQDKTTNTASKMMQLSPTPVNTIDRLNGSARIATPTPIRIATAPSKPGQIPQTGLETPFIMSVGSLLGIGVILRKYTNR